MTLGTYSETITAPAGEDKLTSSELTQGRLFLEQTRNTLLGATRGLLEAQWRFKPAPDRWSIAEILEHVVLVQEIVLGRVREQLANAPVTTNPNYQEIDEIVINRFSNRLSKFKGPEWINPSGRYVPSEALERFVRNCDWLYECLETTPGLRRHMLEAPPLKATTNGAYESMDGYQWVLAAGAHAERHAKQILEVKADPNFPEK